ncbi:N-acetyl-gamma-glutamyl-phosphate reductase [Candidatus Peregrinibacteria bacterium]|nr:N-acetyl-gamma-glutamyl-phosphate reductase [Candidatus Peregrinibacteria bacterium]
MFKKINISIIGVTGFTGIELIRLLVNHPYVKLKYLVSKTHGEHSKDYGQKISDVWPHLKNICDLDLTDMDVQKVAEESDVVFLALPHHESQKIVPIIINKTKIIDLSADFRLHDKSLYAQYYDHEHDYAEGLSQFIYGLPELHKEKIVSAQNIANPGCFAITAELAILPLKGCIEHVSLFAITGSSGAGKKPQDETHHSIRNHNVTSYKIGVHQHIPEIIQELEIEKSQLTFVPTRGPFTRGIHLTAYFYFQKKFSQKKIMNLYKKTYAKAPFVRMKKNVQLADVIGSNFCDIAVHNVNGKFIIQAVIDNLVRGAAGTAIQNMNIMCGFDETLGLKPISPIFP